MKQIGKYTSVFILCLLAVCLLQYTNVSADVIVEPKDQFFLEHRNECEQCNRTYLANSEKGYANIYKSPESGVILTYIENQASEFVSYTYRDAAGCLWGYLQYSKELKGNESASGWILLDDFSLKYDSEEFMKDHKDQMIQEKVEFRISEFEQPVMLWTYPHSGEVSCEIDPGTDYAENYSNEYDFYYEDEEGQKWIYISYYMLAKGWICITDPLNNNIAADETGKVEFYPSASPTAEQQFQKETVWILLAVVGVVVVTAIAIHHIYRKDKKA